MIKSSIFFITILILINLLGCQNSETEMVEKEQPLTRSYKGHENDEDALNLVKKYPRIAGTRLDNCQTCHRAGLEQTDTERIFNSCDYCHLIPFPSQKYKSGIPETYNQTLNAFGIAYLEAGRNVHAFSKIAQGDADGDGFSNESEIEVDRYPGDANSKPDQPLIPYLVLNEQDLIKMKKHDQFLLLNHTRHSRDEYIHYSGVKVKDFLKKAGVDLSQATGITAFAPDGFSIDFSMEDILSPFPRAAFYDFRNDDKLSKSLVEYSSLTPSEAIHKELLKDELWLMIALERDGENLTPASYNNMKGHIEGAGPFRIIAPQTKPGRPDRGIKAQPQNDGWDFSEHLDHNAGRCIRGMCVIRVNPVPEGFEEYDWRNGWSLILEKQIVIYGLGVPVRK